MPKMVFNYKNYNVGKPSIIPKEIREDPFVSRANFITPSLVQRVIIIF